MRNNAEILKNEWVFVNYTTGELFKVPMMSLENALDVMIRTFVSEEQLNDFAIFSDISKVVQIKGGN